MEMLAQMDGTEETLRNLNNAEHRPEDSMQTDEWMYELKHRKSWVSGQYVPSSGEKAAEESGPSGGLKLEMENLEKGGAAPPSWIDTMDPDQIDIVQSSWEKIADKAGLGGAIHTHLLSRRPALKECGDGKGGGIGRAIANLLDAAVDSIDSSTALTPVLLELVKTLRLKEDDFPVFGEALVDSLREKMDKEFTLDVQAAWANAFRRFADIVTEHTTEGQM